jgi:predicted DNA-binding transcriptional regulator AlpA
MLSIVEFCSYAGISRSLYYALKRNQEGPDETRIRSRVLISKATADQWLKSREVGSGSIAA